MVAGPYEPPGPSSTYDDAMRPGERSEMDLSPPEGDTWLGLTDSDVPVAEAGAWVVIPRCGGSVVFVGTARDHAEGRADVTTLEYEAYAEQVLPTLDRVATRARDKWSSMGRVAILHRVGTLRVTEAAVVVAVSAPHRHDAFDAARYCIDEVKATAPIWKREHWAGGVDWGRV